MCTASEDSGAHPAGGVEAGEHLEPSFWTTDAPAVAPSPRLTGNLSVDVAIVGSGFTGLACGYYLKRHAPLLRAVIMEANGTASGASSRNSGLFGPYYAGWRRHMLADPGMADRFRALGRRGYDRLLAFLSDEGIDCDILPGDTLLLADAAQAPALKTQGEGWRELGLDAEWLEGDALAAAIGTRFYAGACGLRQRWRLHPGKLVAGMVGAVRRAEVPIYERSAVLEIEPGPPARLTMPGGTVTARYVVVATNAYTPLLGLAEGLLVPVHHAVLLSRPLGGDQLAAYGLDVWPARLEVGIRTHTMRLTKDGRVSMRETLGYADRNSGIWPGLEDAYARTHASYVTRYPWVRDLAVESRWHCVSAHTENGYVIFGPLGADHVLASVGYNGSGVVACHYHGYLLARHLAGDAPEDYRLLCSLPRPRRLTTEAERREYIEQGIGV